MSEVGIRWNDEETGTEEVETDEGGERGDEPLPSLRGSRRGEGFWGRGDSGVIERY